MGYKVKFLYGFVNVVFGPGDHASRRGWWI